MATPVPEHLRPLVQTIFPYLNVDNVQVTRGPQGHGNEAYDIKGKGADKGKIDFGCLDEFINQKYHARPPRTIKVYGVFKTVVE